MRHNHRRHETVEFSPTNVKKEAKLCNANLSNMSLYEFPAGTCLLSVYNNQNYKKPEQSYCNSFQSNLCHLSVFRANTMVSSFRLSTARVGMIFHRVLILYGTENRTKQNLHQ